MIVTVYNRETAPVTRGAVSVVPSVSLGRNGDIMFSKSAALLIGLQEGDTVSLGQDSEGDFFVFKDKAGLPLRKNDSGNLLFQNQGIRKIICDAYQLDQKVTNRLLIAGQPTVVDKVKYYGLLVRIK